jgi:hypothetical protein
MLYNVTFRHGDSNKFYEYMNDLRPGSYNIKRVSNFHANREETTLVEIDEDEALALTLAVPVRLELISRG